MAARVLAACLLVQGCSFTASRLDDIPQDSDLAGAVADGILAGSLTVQNNAWNDDAFFIVRRLSDGRQFRLEVPPPRTSLWSWSRPPNGLELPGGRAFAARLRPGEYELTNFAIHAGWWLPPFSPAPRFRVAPGRMAYLGELSVEYCIRHMYANQSGIAGGQLRLAAEQDRDLALLGRRYRLDPGMPIEPAGLDADQLAAAGKAFANGCACQKSCMLWR